MAGICSSGIRVACLVALHLCYMVWLSIVRRMDVRTHRSREVLGEDVAGEHGAVLGMKQDGRGLNFETSTILGLGLDTSRILDVGLETRRIGASLVVCGRLIFLSFLSMGRMLEMLKLKSRTTTTVNYDGIVEINIAEKIFQTAKCSSTLRSSFRRLAQLSPTARAARADGSRSSTLCDLSMCPDDKPPFTVACRRVQSLRTVVVNGRRFGASTPHSSKK